MNTSKLFFIFLSLFSLPIWAVNPTQGPLQQDPSLCGYGYNPNCRNTGQPPQKIIRHTNVYVPSKYGALALDSSTNVTGSSFDADSLATAKKLAIRQCSNGGRNKHCKIIVWVRNGCIAAAGGKGRKNWKLATATEKPGYAEEVAMNRCRATGASNCSIVMPESCSVPEGMYN